MEYLSEKISSYIHDLSQSILIGIPTGVIVTILTGLITTAIYRTNKNSILGRRLARWLLNGLGIHTIHHNIMPRDLFIRLMNNAKERIWILDSWIGRPDFIPNPSNLHKANKGVEVKILILGPESKNLLDIRLEAVGKPKSNGYNSDQIPTIIKRCNELEWQCDIRTFKSLPPFNLIIIDDYIFIGLYWADKISSEGPFLEIIDYNSIIYKESIEMFENMFRDASSYFS
ncbi:hypothetical protein [Methylomonas rivi]|uniref:NERD domain-containing protein n=1 Tax=Methylomonas rivi TaxID=2952226 RepID=A0ABT1U9I2_9GAMM|nr:hypothetical protein [Methylomonas sp. WSC-6]MCQ8130529.1 hypothetical protein [Methylomonas sp. WSC-6]